MMNLAARDPRSPRRWMWWLNGLSLVVGAAGAIWLWTHIGTGVIVSMLRAGGPAIAAVVALDLLANALKARALHVFLRPAQRMVRYPRVLAAQLAGSAVADVTPTGALGDATRVTMLLGRAPAPTVVSAVVSYDLISLYVSAGVVIAGLPVAALLGGVPPGIQQVLWASAAILTLVVILAVWAARRGLAATLVTLVSPSRRDRWRERLAELDDGIRDLHGRARRDAFQGFALLLVTRGIAWLQLYTLLAATGVTPDARIFVLLVLAQGPVSRLATIVPLGVGISDAGSAALFVLLGLPPASGAGVALLQRIRQVLMAVFGLGIMVVVQVVDRVILARAEARIRERHP